MQARITRDGDVNEQNAFYSRRSCKQIKQYYSAASDGEYFITVFVNDEFKRTKVWCDMTSAPNQVQAGFTYAAVSGGTRAVQKGDYAGDCAGKGMTMAKYHSNAVLEAAAKLHYCPDAKEDACPWFDGRDEKTNYYICELNADFEGTDHMTHDVAHDEITRAEQGKYVLTYHVTDFSNNNECHPVFRTVIVKDTLPPVIQLRWADKGIVATGDHSHRGLGNVKNPALDSQKDSASQVADPRHDATGRDVRDSANSSILMAEATTGGSAWLAASAAAAVTGLALLGFSQRKLAAVSVPV